MKNVFLKNFRGHLGQLKRAWDALRRNRLDLKNKKADALLFDMINGHRRSLKQCFDSLRAFNRKNRAEEEKKVSRRNGLLRKFLFNNEMKKASVFNTLKRNSHRQQLEDLKTELRKFKGVSRLILAQRAKIMQSFYRALVNRKNKDAE